MTAQSTFYERELQQQVDECRFGLRSVGTAAQAGAGAATIDVVSLEGDTLTLRIDQTGVRIMPVGIVYDSVNSLLLNCSAEFKAAFNRSLMEQLERVAQEQEERLLGGKAPADDEDDEDSGAEVEPRAAPS